MKINKACDLDSISVLPPHVRRSSGVLPGPQSSQKLRSQASQHSFSQGHSSQPGMFSQMSQNSLDDVRLCSQERDNSAKRISSMAPLSYPREESQMPILRSSAGLMNKWSSNSISDYRCHISDELEHKFGVIETSVNRFGMILDSVQSDVMQVNKGTKELRLDYGIQQKLASQDSLLQLMSKEQEDVKNSLAGGLKLVSQQLTNHSCQDKLQEALLPLSALPSRIEESILKLKFDLSNAFANELKAMSNTVKNLNQKYVKPFVQSPKAISSDTVKNLNQKYTEPFVQPPKATSNNVKKLNQKSTEPSIQPPKVISHDSSLQKGRHPKVPHPIKNSGTVNKENKLRNITQKIEMGSWTSVKPDKTVKETQNTFPPIQQDGDWRLTIESEMEMEGVFSSIEEKQTGTRNYLTEEMNEDTRQILRMARSIKRKRNPSFIIID